MSGLSLQEKIENLYQMADALLQLSSRVEQLYSDDWTLLNRSIHQQINDLYSQHGVTVEQEASLCLAILMGYSVTMYANPEDDRRKDSVLKRSRKLLEVLVPGFLKDKLLGVYKEYVSF